MTNISVTWNSNTTSGRTLNVYGKNSAYSAATDLYGNNAGTLIGTIVCGTSTELVITDDYEYIGMRSANNAMYLDEIQITWESVTPALVATPTFNPESGTEFGDEGLNVTITCETTGARIYYTLDGSTPDDGSNYYQSAITLTETTTIKAIAYDSDDNISSVATATYTYIDPNGPGTENNPYTVAQARAAIDAGTGTQGVYATGIVSAIPTAYNSTYGNVTFNMVDEEGDEVFLQAYRCGGDEAANVAVGDVAVVYGNLIKYGSTYEFGQDCEVVSLTHPVITTPVVTVTPNTINAPAEGADGTLALTYENIEEFISFDYYFCDANGGELEGDDPDWIYAEINEENDAYTLDYIIDANDGEARTAYMKVYTFDDELEEVYAIVTVNQAAYEAPNVTWNLSIDETATATENEMTWTSDYATMAVEKGTSSTNTNNYYPGTSGHNYTSTRFYTGSVLTIAPVAGYAITSVEFTATTTGYASALMNSTWTNATASAEGTTVTITPLSGSGAIQATIGATCGFTQVKVYYEQHQAETYDLTISLNENIPFIFVFDANDQNNPLIEDGAAGTVQVLEGTSILVSPDVAEGYVLETLMVNNENVISQLDESGAYTFTMPAENVTISATAVEDVPPTPGEWVMVRLNDLTEDDVFVIVGVYDEDESSFAMPNSYGTGDAPSAVDVTMVGNTLAGDIAENLKWNLSIGEDGYTFYPNGETESWLYCNNTNNGVRVGTNENNVFTMTSEGYLYNNATGRYIGIYNRQDWRCYNSINNNIKDQTFAFYKRVDEGSLATQTLDIEGYGESAGGYHLIASPVSMVRPTFENGFLTEAYDLYYFDQAQDEEWRNYKAKHFNIASGKGYLYASQENTTLTFTGVPYEGNGEIALDYTEDGDFPGWNLIGNPYFFEDAYIDRQDFYVIQDTDEGSKLFQSSGAIHPMQGIFVIAEGEGETVTFTVDGGTAPGPNDQKIVVNVRNNRSNIIDRALIRFGEGRQLPKFMFNPNSTKLYIDQNGEDFAVVRSINENSTPVSFHAAENGNYTLSINAENVEMEYLHLIDNLTGADVDLLATPNYSFAARTTDIANRFRLVYATYDDVNENSIEPFAFFNGSEWVISNEGNATLQVIDEMGRMISSETINGNADVNMNATPGVYMLRLVNGENVKVQKVVVR